METLPELGISLTLETITSLAFLLVTGVYVIFTAVFYYHWQTYSTDIKVTSLTIILYLATTLPLLLFIGAMTYFI